MAMPGCLRHITRSLGGAVLAQFSWVHGTCGLTDDGETWWTGVGSWELVKMLRRNY